MDTTTKEKLVINASNSWKMLSVQFMAAVTAAWTFYAALPSVCTPEAVGCLSQAAVMAALQPLLKFVPAPLLTVILGFVGWYLRIKPQKGITPEVASAKSIDAPQPPVDSSGFPPAAPH